VAELSTLVVVYALDVAGIPVATVVHDMGGFKEVVFCNV
jgi:hypothetical protein